MSPASNPKRQAFTLIELLVVIAIIAVLIALLLPAVQKVREAANRSQCTNNLKQIALAVHNYESTFRSLPGNYWPADDGGDNSPGDQADKTPGAWSWLAYILPFLEQENVYRQGNVTRGSLRQSGVTGTWIKTFLCPSDSAQSITILGRGADLYDADMPLAVTNYKGVIGSNQSEGEWINFGPSGDSDGWGKGDGLFYPGQRLVGQWPSRASVPSWIPLGHVVDGTSNTLMAGEDLPERNIWSGWVFANHANCTAAIPPNQVTDLAGVPYDMWDYANQWSFKSKHPGGVNFAMADGSVRWVANSIPLQTFRALATRAGSEVIQGD